MKNSARNTTIADRLLFVFLIAASVAGIFMSREAASQGNDVIVELNGKEAYTFPLSVDRTVSVTGPAGDAVIEIRDRKARVREASCPNRICVKEGWVSNGVIVCLPNRMVVFVGSTTGKHKGVDAITG